MPGTTPHDLPSKNEPPDALRKVQRWFHLRRLFALDFGWHTKDLRLASITETAPDQFSCTFKPRYFLYRKLLPLLFGRPETMPPHCLNRMISRCLNAIMRDRCPLPGRTWAIGIDYEMESSQPIRINAHDRVIIHVRLEQHERKSRYDGFNFHCRTDDGIAAGNVRYGLLDEPSHEASNKILRAAGLPDIDADMHGNRNYPHVFSSRLLNRYSVFELNHGWQLKEYRPKIFEQADSSRFVISFRPRYRFIRMLAPVLLKRPEHMAIDCSVRMLERCLYPILHLSGHSKGTTRPFITNLKIRCRQPITVKAGSLVPMHLQIMEPEAPPSAGTNLLEFSIGHEEEFKGEVECTTNATASD